ncbi:MAG TPA: response regulator [Terriglobia bacterium]|nr:response regulator [Terriglobia bacterium]
MLYSRVLVVEDHAAVRRAICLKLESEMAVVGEACNGEDAVSMARELQPDVILMDVGLPKLNGLEATRQIRSLAPHARTVFLSLEASPHVAREAFRWGAWGYVHKLQAQKDLIPAINAVLAGKQFLSESVRFKDSDTGGCPHEVQFYSSEAQLIERVTQFVGSAMNAGTPAILLATRSHETSVAERLQRMGFDMNRAVHKGAYIPLEASDTLSRIMVNGMPDRDRFCRGLASILETAAQGTMKPPADVAIFGECVGVLCEQNNTEAAIQLERTGNDLIRARDMKILCAYPLSAFQNEANDHAFAKICEEHTAIHFR